MNAREIKQTEKLLADCTERTDTTIYNNGRCLTAYWIGGGQRIFYTFADVREWWEDNAKNLIKTYRDRFGITQEALARRLGVSPNTVAQWEAETIINKMYDSE